MRNALIHSVFNGFDSLFISLDFVYARSSVLYAVNVDNFDDFDISGLTDTEASGDGLVFSAGNPSSTREVNTVTTLNVKTFRTGHCLDENDVLAKVSDELHNVSGDPVV